MSDDQEEFLRYDKMVEQALRGVVKTALEEVKETGLQDEHHFYITFLTDYPGVDIPEYLTERYPGEMTIVLQYQFYDLSVDNDILGVTLSFNNVPERLVVPLAAITIFADPSVNFALQFQPLSEDDENPEAPDDGPGSGPGNGRGGDDTEREKAPEQETGQVVSLDQFRKK